MQVDRDNLSILCNKMLICKIEYPGSVPITQRSHAEALLKKQLSTRQMLWRRWLLTPHLWIFQIQIKKSKCYHILLALFLIECYTWSIIWIVGVCLQKRSKLSPSLSESFLVIKANIKVIKIWHIIPTQVFQGNISEILERGQSCENDEGNSEISAIYSCNFNGHDNGRRSGKTKIVAPIEKNFLSHFGCFLRKFLPYIFHILCTFHSSDILHNLCWCL